MADGRATKRQTLMDKVTCGETQEKIPGEKEIWTRDG